MANIDVCEDEATEFRWRLTSCDDTDSGEGYGSRGGAWGAIEDRQRDSGTADVDEH